MRKTHAKTRANGKASMSLTTLRAAFEAARAAYVVAAEALDLAMIERDEQRA